MTDANHTPQVSLSLDKQSMQMKLMEATLMFDHPRDRDRATPKLVERGYGVEPLLDIVDECDGVVLTPTVWIEVTGPYEGGEDEFFHEMQALAERFNGGECLEAGYATLPQH